MSSRSVILTDIRENEHRPASLDAVAQALAELATGLPGEKRKWQPHTGFRGFVSSLLSNDGEDLLAVELRDDDGWCLEFDGRTVWLDNLDDDDVEAGELPYGSTVEALGLADEFLRGDLTALRARPWQGESEDD